MSRTLVVVLISLAIGGAIAGYQAQAQDPAPKVCLALVAPMVIKNVDNAIADGKYVAIPAGWSPVGAAESNGIPLVMICR